VLAALALTAVYGGGRKEATVGPELFNAELSGTITVSAYETLMYRSILEDAARSFQALHPGTTVKVETFSAMPVIRLIEQDGTTIVQVESHGDSQGQADYISRVSTAQMSGQGADVYAMDVLPLHKFAAGGQFENLDAYMDADPGFNRADYRENILDALKYRGGVWFLPTDYNFTYLAYDSTLVPAALSAGFGTNKAWTTGELLAIAERYYDGSAKLFNLVDYSPGGGLAHQILYENIENYVDLTNKRVDFLSGGFTRFLELIRRVGERGYVPRGTTRGEHTEIRLPQAGEETERFFFKLRNNFSLVSYFLEKTARRMMMGSADALGDIDDDDGIAGMAAVAGAVAGGGAVTGGARVPFTYKQAYGISSGSKNKALAWAFIKFLVAGEAQRSSSLANSGLPLNNGAREQKARLLFETLEKDGALSAGMEAALQGYIAVTEELSDQINYFQVRDSIVNDMITGELYSFFTGAKTAAQVAAILQNEVDLYLNE
jgi:ABC-type glycerol-3-phosphate transport system substrate-binding protein